MFHSGQQKRLVGLEKWKSTRNAFIAKVNKIKALLHQLSNLCVIYLTLAVLATNPGSQINK